MVSDKKYMPTRDLQVQRSYWARRENEAKMRKQAYEKFLDERGASYGVGVGLDAKGEQVGPPHLPADYQCISEDPTTAHHQWDPTDRGKCLLCGWRRRPPYLTPSATLPTPDMREPPKPVKSSAETFFGRNTIYGVNEGDYNTPYMTRYWVGRLRLHIFHRGDADADPHDHPWSFWTFPLTSYVEEVTTRDLFGDDGHGVHYRVARRVVSAFRLHFRPATHTHRVLGRVRPGHYELHDGVWTAAPTHGKIVTIVWRGGGKRKWGFLRKDATGKRCWIPWRTYVYEGGKRAPCE